MDLLPCVALFRHGLLASSPLPPILLAAPFCLLPPSFPIQLQNVWVWTRYGRTLPDKQFMLDERPECDKRVTWDFSFMAKVEYVLVSCIFEDPATAQNCVSCMDLNLNSMLETLVLKKNIQRTSLS